MKPPATQADVPSGRHSGRGRGLAARGKAVLRTTSLPARRMLWQARVSAYGQLGIFARMRRAQRGGLRILTYHGVCRDNERHLPWIPAYFVTQSLLDRHLRWLREAGEVVSLRTALDLAREGGLRRELVYAITFDDGYFNNLSLAAPILRAHGATATFFLTTAPIDAGGVVPPWMKGYILRALAARGQHGCTAGDAPQVIAAACDWGRQPAAQVLPRLEALWEQHVGLLDAAWLEGVRSLNWQEAQQLESLGMELGAHTVTHPHLPLLPDEARRAEIADSVARVREMTARSDVPFAYPFGRPADVGVFDVAVLRELRVPLAVTTDHGVNRPGGDIDLHRLRRLAVSRRRSRDDFIAMVSGLYDHDRRWQPPD